MMKILHIWNTAGVASLIAKYMDKTFGTKSWVITRKYYDIFDLTTHGESWNCRGKIFILKALWMAKKYDLIHVHSLGSIVPLLKTFYPKKPVILHYHGSSIRGKWDERTYWNKADLVLVSTPDLLNGAPEGVIYLPNPVDTELFKPLKNHNDKTAIYIIKGQGKLGEKLEWSEQMAQKYGLEISFRNRLKDPIPYIKLPTFLNQYSYFIDRDYIKSLSKTALEALSCGCNVVNYNGEVVTQLPMRHNPEIVTKQLADIYTEITCLRPGLYKNGS